MTTQHFMEFEGLDTRRIEALSDTKTARVAKNLYLSSGRVWKTRPGTVRVAVLPSESKGLYPGQGILRTVAPAGYADIFNQQSPLVTFDFVGDGTLYDRDTISEFINAEPFGAGVAAGVQYYGVIRRRETNRLEHYWFRDRPDTPGDTVNTRSVTPFAPSGMVAKLADKVWALNQSAGQVNFSSTQFGANDWTAEGDAGFLPVLANAPGDRTQTGLGYLQTAGGAVDNRQPALVVFFRDLIQIWAVDPDPLNHFLVGVLGGVGTRNFRSIANVLGQPVFFDNGGFTGLRVSQRVGSMDSQKIGSPIEDLTASLDADAITASTWWSSKGLYLAAVGSTVYVWKHSPIDKVNAWSTWTLPYSITDFAEVNDELYFRTTDDEVYKFSDDTDTDDGTAIAFDLETQFLHMSDPGGFKRFDSAHLYQTGACTLSYRPDPTQPTMEVPVFGASGVTRPNEKIPLIALADSMALRFTGTGAWTLSGFAVDYERTGV